MTTTVGALLSTDQVFLQQTSYNSSFTVTNSTTPTQIPSVGSTLVSGHVYYFRCYFLVTNNVTPGYKIGLNGTCTVNWLQSTLYTTSTTVIEQVVEITSLGTTAGLNTATGTKHVFLEGSLSVNSGGTFFPTFAQNVSSGTLVRANGTIFFTMDLT